MKKIVVLALACLMCFSAVGCSMLERSYVNVRPHSSSYYESEDKSVLRAETYQDLVNDLLVIVGERAEAGSIWLYAQDGSHDVQQMVERACQEVQHETPIGSYAVEYMTYTIAESSGAYIDVQLTVSYRRSEEQMDHMVNVTGIAALRDLLGAAAERGDSELAVQLGSVDCAAADVYAIVEEVAARWEGGGRWRVALYPSEQQIGIVEIVMGE